MTFIEQKTASGKAQSRAKTKKRERIPQGLRFDVFRRDNFTCVYCGASSPNVTLECDHKTPKSKGGQDTLQNLVTACFECNRGKSNKDVEHFPRPVKIGGDPLQGRFGHSIANNEILWQFMIIGSDGDTHQLQLYSWLDGCPTTIEHVKTVDLMGDDFVIYATEEAWLRTADMEMARRRREGFKA